MEQFEERLLKISSHLFVYANILMGVQSAHSTTFVNRPFNDVIKESPIIVRGRASDQYSDWGKGKSSKGIFTYTTFIISEVLKGELKETSILLRQPGGEKDGTELHVPGAASFNRDEDLVVLLGSKDPEDGSYDVPGLTTGKYNIVEHDGDLYLENSLGAAAVYDPNKDSGTQSYNSRISLDVFRKMAKGQDMANAPVNQFEQSKVQPKADAYEAGHKHDEIAKAPAVVKQEEVKEQSKETSSQNSGFIPFIFAFIALIGGFALFKVLAKGESK